MTLAEFRELVRQEFGPDLEHITPANVREFLDRVQSHKPAEGTRFRLNEQETTYEGILRAFFRQVLEVPPEEAIIPLWTLALELAFADLREMIAGQVASLFGPDRDDA